MNFKRGPRLRDGVRQLPGARRQPRAIDRPMSMAVVASRAAPSDVAPLAYGVRVAETRGRDRRARRSHRATLQSASFFFAASRRRRVP